MLCCGLVVLISMIRNVKLYLRVPVSLSLGLKCNVDGSGYHFYKCIMFLESVVP